MNNLTIAMLNNFLRAARNRPSSEILKSFLRLVIFKGGLCESGSILVYDGAERKLRLFNDQEFLFKERFLDPAKPWKVEFEPWEGLAGLTFTTRSLQYTDDVTKDKQYVDEGEPIKSMVCVPVVLPSLAQPFGVASFHNGPAGAGFDEDARNIIEVSVNTLSLALQASVQQLNQERSKSVFIVHGRDPGALNTLKLILVERGVHPVVLGDQPRTGLELLQKLDEILKECRAGFVLFTADDVGRLAGDPDTASLPRARQNVIFEAGWLTGLFRGQQKVCFLATSDRLELPSDIHGVLREPFSIQDPNKSRIEAILTEWGIDWTQPK